MSSDRFPTRVVVIALALVVVGGLASIVFLASTQTPIPDAMDRLVFTALGSLGTILARPAQGEGAQDVQVVNDEAAPVPVETAEQAEAGRDAVRAPGPARAAGAKPARARKAVKKAGPRD